MQYELLFLVGNDGETSLETIEKEVERYIEEAGGTIAPDRWESKRKIAYPIKHRERGVYVARRFTLPEKDVWTQNAKESSAGNIDTLSRSLRLHKDILRSCIVRCEKLESLKKFSERKEEERKSHKQKEAEKELKAKKTALPRTPAKRSSTSSPIQQTPQKEAPKKEVSVAEINERLDEILNI